MKCREFIKLLGGAAVGWPFAARAQQIRRLAVLMGSEDSDPDSQARLGALREALRQMGWTAGGNLQIDYRWAAADPDRVRAYAAELVGLTPDVILAHAPAALKELQLEARTVPIVFVMVPVPVAREVVASFARPGGNITVVGPDFVRIEFVIDAHAHDMVRDTGIEVDSNGAPRSTLFPFRNSREADQ
jgi:putative ABC transport system substrate-binding protein